MCHSRGHTHAKIAHSFCSVEYSLQESFKYKELLPSLVHVSAPARGAEPPCIRFCPDFQGLIRVYGFTINFMGFPASFAGSLWLVFFFFSMEKQAINFPKIVHNAQAGSLWLVVFFFYGKTSHKLPKNCAQCTSGEFMACFFFFFLWKNKP